MIRLLFLLHRYLGILVGLVMLLWTVSGIIMMYKPYPELDRWESLSLREPVSLDGCCQLPASPLTRGNTFSQLHLEMLNGQPVLRMFTLERGLVSYNLVTGRSFETVDESTLNGIASRFVEARYPDSAIQSGSTIHNDQWTVYSAYNPHRPLVKYRLDDDDGTEFYLSSRTGEIVQLTTSEQRVWGYLGAVIHWLYPTVLRQHTAVWAQVVIWLTLIGIFLTATGLYIGIRQFQQRASGKRSPYRGMQLYHHYSGLVFGLFTFTWVASGLLSMNPWGALEGEGAGTEVRRLAGDELLWSGIEPTLESLARQDSLGDTVFLEIFPQQGEATVVTHTGDGQKQRLNPATLQADPLPAEELRALAQNMRPGVPLLSAELLFESDSYYYVHHEPREFPVYKVVFDEEGYRHYYLSPVDGRLQQKIDSSLRWYRWLFYGMHRGDFSVLTRSRPFWDTFMLLLLAGVTLICATGTYMGWRRLQTNRRLKQHRAARAHLQVSGSMPD